MAGKVRKRRAPKVVKLEAGVINVVLHPHSPERYLRLFDEARNNKISGRINVNKRARFGSAFDKLTSPSGQVLLGGLFYFYTDLNPDEPWLDDEAGTTADERQLAELKKQIRRLHPEFRTMRFFFDPKGHRFYFEVKAADGTKFSPSIVQKALSSIFSAQHLVDQFGEADDTVIPEKEAIEKILKIKSLRKLEIDIKNPPNPEGAADAFDEVEKYLKKMGAKRMEVTLTKAAGVPTLTPTKKIIELAQVAAANGTVRGTGFDEAGIKVEESTTNHPHIMTYDHVPKTSAFESFRRFVVSKLRQ